MFLLSNKVTGVFPLVCNAGLPDDEAAALIEAAALQATEEVRAYAYQARQTEKHLKGINDKNAHEQAAIATGNIARHEAEAAEGKEKQRQLAAKENAEIYLRK